MSRRQIIVLSALAVLLAFLLVRFFRTGNREEIHPPESVASPAAGESPPESAGLRRAVTVYFPREGDDLLVGEIREIAADSAPAGEARAILAELLKGSAEGNLSPFPPETKLVQVYVTKNGTAYVDFSREVAARHPSGTSAEMATIYAVVNSLTANLKTVKRVFILVDGEEKETLSGHISLDRSLRSNMTLVAKK